MTLIHPTAAAALAASKHTARAPLTWDPTSHLLSRFSFGATPATRAAVQQHGVGAWYASQVKAGSTYRGYSGNKGVQALGPMLAMSPYDVRQTMKTKGNEYGWDSMNQLCQVTLGLQAWSKAQLYETLVDFFSNPSTSPTTTATSGSPGTPTTATSCAGTRWAASPACCWRRRRTRRC